jgi:hypothetical protein
MQIDAKFGAEAVFGAGNFALGWEFSAVRPRRAPVARTNPRLFFDSEAARRLRVCMAKFALILFTKEVIDE